MKVQYNTKKEDKYFTSLEVYDGDRDVDEGEEKKVRFGYNKPKRLIGFNGIITNKVWVLRKSGSHITTPRCISNPPTYPFPSDTMVYTTLSIHLMN